MKTLRMRSISQAFDSTHEKTTPRTTVTLSFADSPLRATGEILPASERSDDRVCLSVLRPSFENQLLYAPIQQFGDVEFGLRRAGHFVDPTELLELLARLPKHAQNLALQAELVDPAGITIRTEQHLMGSRCNADGPRCAGRHRPGGRGRLVADGRTRVRI